VRNQFVSDNLDFIEDSYNETQKTAKDRVAWIRNYIENLEKENAELGWFFSCVSKLVREQTDGEDS